MIRMTESENKMIGKRIRQRRRELSLSQEQLAELIDCSTVHMSRIERKGQIGIRLLVRVAQVLGISVDELVGNFPSQNAVTDKVCLMMLSRSDREQRILFQMLEEFCELLDRHKDPNDQFWR